MFYVKSEELISGYLYCCDVKSVEQSGSYPLKKATQRKIHSNDWGMEMATESDLYCQAYLWLDEQSAFQCLQN